MDCIMNNTHTEEISSLFSSKEYLYPVWYFQLLQGFNIILHGYGSKRIVLRKFCESPIVLESFKVFFIDGINQSLLLENILLRLHQDYIASYDGSFGSLKKMSSISEKSKYVLHSLDLLMKQSKDPTFNFIDERPKPILFAISNIDGTSLTSPIRSTEIKSFLYSLLGLVRDFRLISTIDHINSPLLIDPAFILGNRFLFYDTTTFLNFQEEIKYCDFSVQKGKRILDGDKETHLNAVTVLNNLSLNARKIYTLFLHVQYKWACINGENILYNTNTEKTTSSKSIRKMEAISSERINSLSLSNLENSPSVNNLALKLISSPTLLSASGSITSLSRLPDFLQFPGISFSIFFNLALENFLASNEVAFKTIIQEFLDHNILSCKKSDEGEEMYYMPFKLKTLVLISSELKL